MRVEDICRTKMGLEERQTSGTNYAVAVKSGRKECLFIYCPVASRGVVEGGGFKNIKFTKTARV